MAACSQGQYQNGCKREHVVHAGGVRWRLLAAISPVWVWLLAISALPHKEERFLFPAYGHVVLNAAVAIYLARGWVEAAFLKVTASPRFAAASAAVPKFGDDKARAK